MGQYFGEGRGQQIGQQFRDSERVMITKIGQEEEEASIYRSVTREKRGQGSKATGRLMITKKGRVVFSLQATGLGKCGSIGEKEINRTTGLGVVAGS